MRLRVNGIIAMTVLLCLSHSAFSANKQSNIIDGFIIDIPQPKNKQKILILINKPLFNWIKVLQSSHWSMVILLICNSLIKGI